MRSRIYKSAFRQAYLITYPPDGFDPIKLTYNGEPISNPKILEDYYRDWITIITSFMRVPNQIPDGATKQSWNNIGNNLIGWQENKSEGRNWINRIKYLVAPIYNISVVAFNTTIRSPIKSVTELLTAYLSNICKIEALLTIGELRDERNSIPKKIGYGILLCFESLGVVISESLFIIGQAITSPFKGIDYCYELGQKIIDIPYILSGKKLAADKTKTLGGKILGCILAGLSATISATAITAAVFFLSPVIVTVGTAVIGASAASPFIIATGASIIATAGFVATLTGAWLSTKWTAFNHWYNRTDNAKPKPPENTNVSNEGKINHIQLPENKGGQQSPAKEITNGKIVPISPSNHSHKLTDNFITGEPKKNNKDNTPKNLSISPKTI